MIPSNSYYTVQGWMREELGLKGNALAVYAIIYGFSQDGASEYAGSSRYLAEWLGCSKQTVLACLNTLTEQGLLIKKTIYQNGVTFCNYVAARNLQNSEDGPGEEILPPVKNFDRGGQKITPGVVKNFDRGGQKTLPHITSHNDRYIDKDIDKAPADATGPADPPGDKVENGKKTEKAPKHKRGEFGNVLLTDKEHDKLVETFGADLTAKAIEYLDMYIPDKKYKSTSHYMAIRRWVIDAVKEREERQNRPGQYNAPRGGAAYPGTMGPNGIAIDPTKTDLDGIF